MRTFAVLTLTLFFHLLWARGQSAALADSAPPPDRSFHLLREDEDWSFLADPALRRDFWDPIKYIRLRAGHNDWFMTISGEAREVWEQIGNDYWGQAPYWNGYLNGRHMLGFDIHYGKHLRTFVDLKSGINSFRYGGPRPIDEKKLDFQSAFLQIGTTLGQNFMELRVGRLESSQLHFRLRPLPPLGGPNLALASEKVCPDQLDHEKAYP